MARVRNIEWSDVEERNPGGRRTRNVRVCESQEQIENEEESSDEWPDEDLNRRFEGFDDPARPPRPHVRAALERNQGPERSFGLVRAVRSRPTLTESAWIVCQQYPGMSFSYEVAMEIMRQCTLRPDVQHSGEVQGDQTTGSDATEPVVSDPDRSANFGNSGQSEAPSSSSRSPGFQHSRVQQGHTTPGTRSAPPVFADDNQLTSIGNKTHSATVSVSSQVPEVQRSGELQDSQALGTELPMSADQNQLTNSRASTQYADLKSHNRSEKLQGDSTAVTEAPVPALRDPQNFDDNIPSAVSSPSSRLSNVQHSGRLQGDPADGREQPEPIVQNEAANIGSKAHPELPSSPERLLKAQGSVGLQDDETSTAEAPVSSGQISIANSDSNSQSAPCSSANRVSRKRSQTAGDEAPKNAKEMKVASRKASKVRFRKQNPQPHHARDVNSKPPLKPTKKAHKFFPRNQSRYGTSHRLSAQDKPVGNRNSSRKAGAKPSNVSNRKVVAKSRRKPSQTMAITTQNKGSSTSSHPAGEPSISGTRQSSNITRKVNPQPIKYSQNRPAGEFPNLFGSLTRETPSEDLLESQHVGVANLGAESLHSLQSSAYDQREASLDCLVPGPSKHSSGATSDDEHTSIDDYLEETSSDYFEPGPSRRLFDGQSDVGHSCRHGHLEETLSDQVVPGSSNRTFGRPRSSKHGSRREHPEETGHVNPGPSRRDSGRPRRANVLNECDDMIYFCTMPPLWLEGAATPFILARAQPPSIHRGPGGVVTSPHGCPYQHECAVNDSGVDSEGNAHNLMYQQREEMSYVHREPGPSTQGSDRPTGSGGRRQSDAGPVGPCSDRPRGAVGLRKSHPGPSMVDSNRPRGTCGLGERDPGPSRQDSGKPRVASGQGESNPVPSWHGLVRPRGRNELVESDPGPSRQNSKSRGSSGMGYSDPGPLRHDRNRPRGREPGQSRQDSNRPRGIGELRGSDIDTFVCPEASLWHATITGVLDTVFWVPIDKAKLMAFLHKHGVFVNAARFGCEPKQKSPQPGVRRKVRIKRKRRYRSSRPPTGVSSSSSPDSDSTARSRRRKRTRQRRKRSRPEPKDSSRSSSTSPDQR